LRKALIVLVVVALVLVALGAVNHGLLFDIDFVVGTWTAVSLFWVAVVIAGVVLVTGMVVAFFSRTGAVATRRKLEKELQGTYERLRAAEAKLPKPAPAQAAVVDVAPGEHTAVTGVVPAPTVDETRTAVIGATPEADTVVATEAPEAAEVADASPEADTVVAGATPEADTVVATEAPEAAEVADATPAADSATAAEPATAAEDAPPPAAS
jgi:hypothetical protein